MRQITVNLPDKNYSITIGQALISHAGEYFDLKRRVVIVTDTGVPREYAEAIKASSESAEIYTVAAGEGSKSLTVLEGLLTFMSDFGMKRTDALVAVGGGVVGDLTGFAAATYMRGIDFYNVPTTTLAQLDSSIGGKTAVNLGMIKNIVGAFHQPRGVLIDTDVLKTLPRRHFAAGLAEAVKMSVTSDPELFKIFECEGVTEENLEKIIYLSLEIKRKVVEEDEREGGLRRVLNLGHTFGHGIEAEAHLSGLYHGECVALGMLPVVSEKVRKRLLPVLSGLGLPTEYHGSVDKALSFVTHDKKCESGGVNTVLVDEVGSFRIEKLTLEDFNALIKKIFKD